MMLLVIVRLLLIVKGNVYVFYYVSHWDVANNIIVLVPPFPYSQDNSQD